MVLRYMRLEEDVDMEEEVELRRLSGDTPGQVPAVEGGAGAQGAACAPMRLVVPVQMLEAESVT